MEYPTGVVPKVEHQWSHQEFVKAVQPNTILVDIVSARQIVKNGEDSSSYFGENTNTITTTTVPDEKLHLISWERERDIVTEFSPTYHIPTDYSIYGHQNQDERIEALEKMAEGTKWMANELADVDVTIIPQIKGFTTEERRITYTVAEDVSRGYACYYATQYFSGGGGNRINHLRNHLTEIKNETAGFFNLLVIGLLSPRYVATLDSSVIAVSGQYRWRSRVSPRKHNEEQMRETYDELRMEVESSLDS